MSDQDNEITIDPSLPQELLTVPEFCRVAKIGKTKLYAMIASGKLPVIRFGRCIRIHPRVLEGSST